MINNSLIYDIETLKELFLVCFRDVKTQKKKTFFVHKDYSNLKDLIDFLASCKQSDYYFIGFNNLHFDSQIIEFIWMNYISWCKNSITNENIILQIYNEAQRIVNLPDESKYLSLLPEWKLSFKQIDLYLIHHYNNKNKRTSLKYLEFTMKMDSIEEMPIHHDSSITLDDIHTIELYCLNDIEATYQFYLKSIEAIKLREDFKDKYDLNCLNWNDVKLGNQLLLDIYCKKEFQDKNYIKTLRSPRTSIKFSNLILPIIDFKNDEFKTLLAKFKSTSISNTKGEFTFSLKYKGITYEYGQGGIHGCNNPGVYNSDDEYIIYDLDIGSLYPSIAVNFNLFPEHLRNIGEIYSTEIVQRRLDEKSKGKVGDKNLIAALKLAANGGFFGRER